MAKTQAQLDREIAIAISDRRIAALRKNGEDKRNTVAWQDAMSERRMLNIMTNPSKRPQRDDRTKVTIRWYVIPNGNTRAGGFLPVYDDDGKQHGNTWWHRGYDKATAEKMAEEMAREAASRYVGDWNVSVAKKAGRHG